MGTKRSATRILGRSVARLEDPPLLTGRGVFVGDIGFPHQLHMRVVRSPYANAALHSVDIAPALAAPGIVAVLSAFRLRCPCAVGTFCSLV